MFIKTIWIISMFENMSLIFSTALSIFFAKQKISQEPHKSLYYNYRNFIINPREF